MAFEAYAASSRDDEISLAGGLLHALSGNRLDEIF
jgi:hypothetical protein